MNMAVASFEDVQKTANLVIENILKLVFSISYTSVDELFTFLARHHNTSLNSLHSIDKTLLEYTLKYRIRDASNPQWIAILDLCLYIHTTEPSLVDESFPLTMIEDLVEIKPVEQVNVIFDYILTRQSLLLKGMIPGKGKSLIILRICNEMLKTCSYDGYFCGRIILFLSSIFPIHERSAVNLKGTTSHGIKYLIDPPDDSEEGVDFSILTVPAIDHKSIQSAVQYDIKSITRSLIEETNDDPIPYKFYQLFWKFLEYCHLSLSHTLTEWPLMSFILVDIVSLFESLKDFKTETELSYSVPFYLTGRKVFRHQLLDKNFKLRWTFQCVLFSSQLLDAISNSIEGQIVDKDKKVEFLKLGLSKCQSLISRYSQRESESLLLDIIMSDESHWIEWKKNGCLAFDCPPVLPSTPIMPQPHAEYIKRDIMNTFLESNTGNSYHHHGDDDDDASLESLKEFCKVGSLILTEDTEMLQESELDPVSEWKKARLKVFKSGPAVVTQVNG